MANLGPAELFLFECRSPFDFLGFAQCDVRIVVLYHLLLVVFDTMIPHVVSSPYVPVDFCFH